MPWGEIAKYANWALQIGMIVAAVIVTRWRCRSLIREVAALPVEMQRLVGVEPFFTPPPEERLPEGLRLYAARYRRSRRPERILWLVALLWLVASIGV